MKLLITGATGFSGRALAYVAQQNGADVYGLSRQTNTALPFRIFQADLPNYQSVAKVMQQITPDTIVHLAAQTPANTKQADESSWLHVNQLATYHLLEAARHYAPQARIIIASSSAIYGHVPEANMPITEAYPIQPTTMYGVSKATQELLAMRYVSEYGMSIIRARPFNQVGVGEPSGMLTSTLAIQVAQIKAGLHEPVIRMWHRSTQRDFTDIRDTAQAYWALLHQGIPGDVYNICSGRAVPIGVIAEELLRIAGIEARIEETGGAPRRNDILIQAGNNTKIATATGWQPTISLRQSLADLLQSLS
jgi:GDP-4-dehydro-6-deoxy-D-mannose reductase